MRWHVGVLLLLVALLELVGSEPPQRAHTNFAQMPESPSLCEHAPTSTQDGQLGRTVHYLYALHLITIKQKLARLGVDSTSIRSNNPRALEKLLAAAKDRSPNSWVAMNDPYRPPYYQHRVVNVVRWVPGKWRQRRSLSRSFSAATSSAQAVVFHEPRDNRVNAGGQMSHAMWAMWVVQGVSIQPHRAAAAWFAQTVALLVGSAAAACLCFVAGMRHFRRTARPTPCASPPDGLLCPISLELMVDPVLLLGTGQTYERAAIVRWLHTNSTDPITNVELSSKKLVPNFAIRKLVLEWLAEHPGFTSPVADTDWQVRQPTQCKRTIGNHCGKQ